MKGWLLGTGGGTSIPQRSTACALLRQDKRALLIDAGTGVARLRENKQLLDGVQQLDVILTHFHLDHVIGLPYLPSLELPKPPMIYGTGALLYGRATREILMPLLSRPLLSTDITTITSGFHELDGQELQLGPFFIQSRPQTMHSDPTLALRVNDQLTYCTDTSYDPQNATFADGCKVLAHEAWWTTGTTHDIKNHTSAAQAASIARDAGVTRLVLIHINPTADENALLDDARFVFPNTQVGTDLMPLVQS
jgi:ribonuclease BN (tRNA processing enzyme)